MLIKESFTDITTSYGTKMRIFTYHPFIPNYPNLKFPGVLVYSEIYQVTGPVQRFAKDIATQGYIVACPSIYHNWEPSDPLLYDVEGTDKGNKYKVEKPVSSYDEDNKLTIDYLLSLPSCNGKIGATGMCLGGHLLFRACLDQRVSLSICFFPTDIHDALLGKGGDDSLARCKEMSQLEIFLIFGTLDNHVPPAGRDLIRLELRKLNLKFSFLEICDAQHAFVRDESSKDRYDGAVTKACFSFLDELFNRKLRIETGAHDGKQVVVENVC